MNDNKGKKRNLIISILGVIGLIGIVTGVSVAFFNYTRTGNANTIAVGRIYFNSTQNNTINLTNVFPIASGDVATDNGNHDTVTITITGDTMYSEGIEYLVTLDQVNNTINGKKIPIVFNVSETNIGTSSSDYWNERGGTTSIYELTETGEVEEDKYVLVGYITKGAAGVNGSIDITAYVDASKIAITDTIENGNIVETGYTNGTTSDWINGRTVFTTEEWNSFNSTGLTFKIRVEANEGIWVEDARPMYTVGVTLEGQRYEAKVLENNSTYADVIAKLKLPERSGYILSLSDENGWDISMTDAVYDDAEVTGEYIKYYTVNVNVNENTCIMQLKEGSVSISAVYQSYGGLLNPSWNLHSCLCGDMPTMGLQRKLYNGNNEIGFYGRGMACYVQFNNPVNSDMDLIVSDIYNT